MQKNGVHGSYSENIASVTSQKKLVEMLFEGAMRFASVARKYIEEGDIEKKVLYINKTCAIFTELLNSLDYERGGDVAHYLSGLYAHQLKLLAKANIENDVEHIDVVIKVLRGLIEAWRETEV